MNRTVRVALIGDHDPAILAHRAIPEALARAADDAAVAVEAEWIATDTITPPTLANFDGIWCTPGSPYRSMDGALAAIRHARERGIPFLGTCGGFQHALLEYARNVLGWHDAEHAETAPNAARTLIAPLTCSLVEVSGRIRFTPETRLARAYETGEAHEGYHCRYALNPEFRAALTSGDLRVAAVDDDDDVRAVELATHPFFVATLFQPERAALSGRVPPIVRAFVASARRG